MSITNWKIDPTHSSISFSIKHMMIAKVHGGFEKVAGSLTYNSKNLNDSAVDIIIDVNTINTREPQRDTHLKSADFFDVQKFPSITFKSKKVDGNIGSLKVVGDLYIHGVTQEVTLDVDGPTPELKDPYGNIKIGASATTKIKRKDFGLTWNAALEAGGFLVGDDVNITIDVQFIKQA